MPGLPRFRQEIGTVLSARGHRARVELSAKGNDYRPGTLTSMMETPPLVLESTPDQEVTSDVKRR